MNQRVPIGAGAMRRSGHGSRFSGLSSLATRILVVNLIALVALAGALIYIESFRMRLLVSREHELVRQGATIAQFIENLGTDKLRQSVLDISDPRGTHIRVLDANGTTLADNWENPNATRFALTDPTTEGFRRESAILIDRTIDFLMGQREWPLVDDNIPLASLPEVRAAQETGEPQLQARQTEDRLVVLQAVVPVVPNEQHDGPYSVVVMTVDTPDVIDLVRRERFNSFLVFLVVLGFSLALSIYLARTIVVPLRQLEFAAHRVRLGRQRDVVVPRLPHRRDEIGGLARALADMTAALRQRIDATEAFAADVAHELKNPLASLRSAIEALGIVKAEEARRQLFDVIDEDVRRIDRLITDISAASRLDAELSRARLQPTDVGLLVDGLVSAQMAAGLMTRGTRLAADVQGLGTAIAVVDADRLSQVVNNLIDNAVSFSPEGGTVRVSVNRLPQTVEIQVMDEGPGVPEEAREAIFERFYSERPGHEDYGKHSGLGLSIARSILEAMDGTIRVTDRPDGAQGALFVVTLPAA